MTLSEPACRLDLCLHLTRTPRRRPQIHNLKQNKSRDVCALKDLTWRKSVTLQGVLDAMLPNIEDLIALTPKRAVKDCMTSCAQDRNIKKDSLLLNTGKQDTSRKCVWSSMGLRLLLLRAVLHLHRLRQLQRYLTLQTTTKHHRLT